MSNVCHLIPGLFIGDISAKGAIPGNTPMNKVLHFVLHRPWSPNSQLSAKLLKSMPGCQNGNKPPDQ